VPGTLGVIATAGHVDHGKSALIVSLTGIDPDRFEEEKRRGLTIDLGYAWTTLPSGREVGFVDVPGHERFIRNMLAGVGPVRLVLFVVAADEGWKPQSEEHLRILELVGIRHGIVALTKIDVLDDPDLVELAALEVADHLASRLYALSSLIDRYAEEIGRHHEDTPQPADLLAELSQLEGRRRKVPSAGGERD